METQTNSPKTTPSKKTKGVAPTKKKHIFLKISIALIMFSIILFFVGDAIIYGRNYAPLSIPTGSFIRFLSGILICGLGFIACILLAKNGYQRKKEAQQEAQPKQKHQRKQEAKCMLFCGVILSLLFLFLLSCVADNCSNALYDIKNGPQKTVIYNADIEEEIEYRHKAPNNYFYYLTGTTSNGESFRVSIFKNNGDLDKVIDILGKSSCFEVSYFEAMRDLYDIEVCGN